MDAKTYLQTHGKEATAALADSAGSKLSYFIQFASGHRKPSPKLAKLLVEKSNGVLDFESLLFPPHKKKEAA